MLRPRPAGRSLPLGLRYVNVGSGVGRQRRETINLIQSFRPDELYLNNPLDAGKAYAVGLALAAEVAPY